MADNPQDSPALRVAYRWEASPRGAAVYAECEGVTLCAAVARFPARGDPQVRCSASNKELAPELGRLLCEAVLGCLERAERLAADPEVRAAARAVAEAEAVSAAVMGAKVLAAGDAGKGGVN